MAVRTLHPPGRALPAVLLVAGCLAGVACSRHGPAPAEVATSPADLRGITALHEAFISAHNGGDVDRLVGLFTDDAVLMPADEATCEGKDAIGDYLDNALQESPSTIEFDVQETKVLGDWAFEWIDATLTSTDADTGEEVETWARYVWILRRQPDGSWRIARAIDNIDESGDEDDGLEPQSQA